MISDVKNHLMATLGLPEEMLGDFVDSFLMSFDESVAELKPFAEGATPDWMTIRRITHTIKGYADGETVLWLDFNSKLLDEKGDTKRLMNDRLHPNADGYKVWLDAILPHFKAICGK